MKPVLIFEHIDTSRPGLFGSFLEENAVPSRILRPNQGDSVPEAGQITGYAGLCFLGGRESVTRPSEAMKREMALIQAAHETGLPVIGHCLGGQLISRALGGQVTAHSHAEFGWSRLSPDPGEISGRWLEGLPRELYAMQWHSDVFSLPPGAKRILRGEHSPNQAFVHGRMLAMQFHVEIDRPMIEHWALALIDRHPAPAASVQSGEEIMALAERNFTISRRLAESLYSRWLEFLE